MKKLISLVLGVAIICGSLCCAEEDLSVSQLSRETDIVKSLGLIDAIEKADSKSSTVSRIEFAAIIANLSGVSGEKKQIFSDVAAQMKYSECVFGLYNSGIIAEAESFRPNAPITGAEAIKMAVCALGYKYRAELDGGFPAGYFLCASRIGLYNKFELNDPLTVDDVGKMIYSTFEIDAMTQSGVNGGNTYTSIEGETLPKITYGITKHFGIMKENTLTGLTYAKPVKDNSVKIDNTIYNVKSGINADEFLGESVEYFLKEDGGDFELVYITEQRDVNNSKDLLISDVKFQNGALNYYTGNKERTLQISPDADYIYNCKADPGYSLAGLPSDNGRIRLVDNDNNGVFDVVKIMYYENKVLKGTSEYFKNINFGDGTKINLSGKDFDIFDKNGAAVDFEGIPENSIVSVARSKNSDYFRFIVCDDVIAGKVDKITAKNGKNYVFVGGKEYILDGQYARNNGTVEAGEYYMFYLDFMGYIVMSENKTITSRCYGYLLGISVPKGLENKSEIKFMDEYGKVRIAESAKYICFNGETKDAGGNKYKGAELRRLVASVTSGSSISQLIVYKTNSNGEIYYVETANSTTGEDAFVKNKVLDSSNSRYVSIQNSFFLNYGVNDNTKIFVASAGENGDVDEKNIKMISVGELINNKYYTGAEIYDADKMNIAGAVVIPLSAEYIYADNVMLVEGVGSMINSKSSAASAIEGLYCGEMKTFCVSELYEGDLSAALGGLEKGDIIRLMLNSENEIMGIDVLFSSSSSDRNNLHDSAANQLYRLAYNYYLLGSVINREDDMIYVALSQDGTDRSVYKLDSETNIYVYNSKTDKIEKGDISSIETYGENFISGSQRVFIKFRYDVIYDLIILS